MTIKKDHNRNQTCLKKSEKLKLATLDYFRAMFTAFWAGKGRGGVPTDIMVTIYWEKLKNFPEMIIDRMLEDYLHDGDTRFPSVGEMAYYCRDLYGTHLARRAIKKPEPVEENLSEAEKEYRIAVRKAVWAVWYKNLEQEDRRALITKEVHRLANEHDKLPITEYLAWQP